MTRIHAASNGCACAQAVDRAEGGQSGPVKRMLKRIPRLALGARLLLAAGVGALGALGQAPFDVPVAMLLSLTGAFILWRSEETHPAAVGWAFGTGYFALSLMWIVEPFLVDVKRHGWMAPFALLFLSTGLALFWAAAFRIAKVFGPSAVSLVLCWSCAELLRAYVLTGFPWANPAQVAVTGPISVLLAWAGPHGVTFVLLSLAAVLSIPARSGNGAPLRLGQSVLFVAGAVALSVPQARAPVAETDHRVRLIQPNAAQHLKWQPDMAQVFFERQRAFTAAPPDGSDAAPDLIVWPETAIPWRLESAAPVLDDIAQAAGGATVALGVLRYEGDNLRNALAVIAPDGSVSDLYDKHHLVPFGEYMPFAGLFDRLGIGAIAASAGRFSSGPGPAMLDFGALGKAMPLICYEAVFAHGVNAMPERASFLLQVTNDAWFGAYAGPQQHLAQARMRAIEQGLPLLRAANTGISAVIDPTGRIVASLPLNEAGFVDAAIPAALPSTLYSRFGDRPVVAFIVVGLIVNGFFSMRTLFRVRN